jgi:hypothetical protein
VDKGKIIVIQFVALDGVVEDSGGTPGGGWAFRPGAKAMNDDFKLGSIFETGVLLFGHATWDMFAGRWPTERARSRMR